MRVTHRLHPQTGFYTNLKVLPYRLTPDKDFYAVLSFYTRPELAEITWPFLNCA